MQLKRIVASDTRNANEQAIALYGPDVLIVSNNRVNGQVELVVAVDIPDLGAKSSNQAFSKPVGAGFGSHMNLFQLQSQARTKVATTGSEVSNLEKVFDVAESGPLISEKINIEQEIREKQRSKELMSLIREEMSALRREFAAQKNQGNDSKSPRLTHEVRGLLTMLCDHGMSANIRQMLISDLEETLTISDALNTIRTQFQERVFPSQWALPAQGIHLIAGPSGAGKTLMLGKLANMVGSNGIQGEVAIISYKDSRVGAWSQTQMLCAQAGVDCFRAANPETLARVLREISPRKLVLIDTASSNMMSHIQEVLTVAPSCSCHAVVATDSSLVTLNRILNMQDMTWNSLMLSKLDESVRPWALIECLMSKSVNISLVGDGPEIHQISNLFSLDSLIDKVLGDLEDEHIDNELNFIKTDLNFSAITD